MLLSGQIARGITTPAALGVPGEATPAPEPMPSTPFEERRRETQRDREESEHGAEEQESKRQKKTELPPEGTLIQEAQMSSGEVADAGRGEKRVVDEPVSPPTSPKRDRLYAAGFAGDIRMVEIEHTSEDEEEWLNYMPEVQTREEAEAVELKNEGWQGHDEDHPPEVDADTLARLDDVATDEGIARLEKIPVMEKVDDAAARELNMITTRVVLVWKKRQEKQGWFRRARLVARQFWSTTGFDGRVHVRPDKVHRGFHN